MLHPFIPRVLLCCHEDFSNWLDRRLAIDVRNERSMEQEICLGSSIYQAVMSLIQVLPIGNELPHTSELKTIQLTLGWVDLASFVLLDDS